MDGIYAGALAGALTTITMHPLDLAKVRLQLGRGYSLFGVFKELRQHHWSGIYRGLAPNLFGNTVAWGAYFGIYDALQSIVFGPTLNWQASSSSYLGCAFTAGILSQVLTNPVWVIKTRILGSKPGEPRASARFLLNVSQVYKHSGIKGFWRGFWPGTLGTVQSSLYFAIYDPLKPIIRQWKQDLPDTFIYFSASALAKSIAATIMYPHQVIRSRMQFSEMGILEAIRDVWLKEKYFGFYKGLSANLVRVVPAMAITLVSYETTKKWLAN